MEKNTFIPPLGELLPEGSLKSINPNSLPPTREKGPFVPHGWIFPLKRKELQVLLDSCVKKGTNETALFATSQKTNRVYNSGLSVRYSYCSLSTLAMSTRYLYHIV